MKRDGRRSFAFITFKHAESVPYAEAIMENVFLFNRPLRLAARSSAKDFNNNPNEPYTPEIYGNDPLFQRSSSWQTPPQLTPQQTLPIPMFTTNTVNNSYDNNNTNHNYSSVPHHSHDDRMNGPRYDRRKAHAYHPYNRNEQDYSHVKQRNGNYNQQRRGGAGGYNNYYR